MIPTTPLTLEPPSQDERDYKTDFTRLVCDLGIIRRAQKCSCGKFQQVLESIRLTAINKMDEKYRCVMVKVPYIAVNASGVPLVRSIEGELRKAKSDIDNYIGKLMNISSELLKELTNTQLESQITEIINKAIARQSAATKRLIEIGKAVPIQVNSRFAEFDRELKLKDESIALARRGCLLKKCE